MTAASDVTRKTGRGAKLPRDARVRKRGAFVEIQREGAKVAGSHLLLFVREQRHPGPLATDARLDRSHGRGRARLGVTVSRRVGGAVVRNHVKRILREVYRLNQGWFSDGRDYVFVARPEAASLDFHAAEAEVKLLCQRSQRRGPRA